MSLPRREVERRVRNVCAIRRLSDGAFWQSNAEHGSGWTDRIRQAWTPREAAIEVRRLFEHGWQPAGTAEVVELHPIDPPTPKPRARARIPKTKE